jgi:hypothetical protein
MMSLRVDSVEQLNKSAERIFLYGKVNYLDMFGHQHETAWSLMYIGGEKQFIVLAEDSYSIDFKHALALRNLRCRMVPVREELHSGSPDLRAYIALGARSTPPNLAQQCNTYRCSVACKSEGW